MSKLNKAVTIIAKIAEVFMWIGAAFSVVITGLVVTNNQHLMGFFTDAADQSVLATGGFSIMTEGLTSNQLTAAFIVFFITLLITCVLLALVFRNIHLIFDTAAGKTKFSVGETPFQPEIIRMVREIGIFCIAIPIIELLMSIIGTVAIGSDAAEISVTFGGIFIGLVVLCLSQFFTYGAQLQQETDGLV